MTPQYTRLLWAGPLTVAASNLAVLAVRVVAFAAVDGLSPEYPPLTVFGLTLFTTVLVTAAVLVFAVVLRMAKTPILTYRRIALVALVISCIPDLLLTLPSNQPPATWPEAILLMVMHVAAWVPVRLILAK